jgi:hypothetical protein
MFTKLNNSLHSIIDDIPIDSQDMENDTLVNRGGNIYRPSTADSSTTLIDSDFKLEFNDDRYGHQFYMMDNRS